MPAGWRPCPPDFRPTLLLALQEQEFERLGSTRTVRVDVRQVAGTNRYWMAAREEEWRDDPGYQSKHERRRLRDEIEQEVLGFLKARQVPGPGGEARAGDGGTTGPTPGAGSETR